MHDPAKWVGTSWGKRPELEDVRAFRRYNVFLCRLAHVGEVAVCVLAIAVISEFLALLYADNFENVIFWDGTPHTCVLHGAAGDIVSVD